MPSVKVKGMSCGHCVSSVTKALKALPGINALEVSLDAGLAKWQDTPGLEPVKKEAVIAAIKAAGFDAE